MLLRSAIGKYLRVGRIEAITSVEAEIQNLVAKVRKLDYQVRAFVGLGLSVV
jgi:hypothetical protein